MVCCCICCAGEGFCSNLLSIMVSLAFSFHMFGFVSPHWYRDIGEKGLQFYGLYYTCNGEDCDAEKRDKTLLALAVIVLISSLALAVIFCCILHCSQFRWKSMTPGLAAFIGIWFISQEAISVAILVTIASKYDSISWSAYVFCLPGIVFMAVVILALIYMMCQPEHRVFASD